MKKKGFTLIELLIVIAIIAILATIIILNVINARAKANDSKMLATASTEQKVVGVCIAEEAYIRDPDSAATPEPLTIADVKTSRDGNICTNATVAPGTWYQFTGSGIKGTKGNWTVGELELLTQTTYRFDYRATDSGGNYYNPAVQINCTGSGCVKQNFQ